MKHTLYIIATLFSLTGNAQYAPEQQHQIDSLKKVIAKADHDSTVIKALIDWDNIIYTEFIDEGIRINMRIDSICDANLRKKNKKNELYFFRKNKAYALNCVAMYYTDKGMYNAAIDFLDRSLKMYEIINFENGIAAVNINYGRLYLEKNDYKKALPYLTNALKIKRKIKDIEGVATACLNIGNAYYNLGNYVEAIRYATTSLKEFEKIKYDIGISYAWNNIGLIYQEQGEVKKAIDAYEKSLEIRKKLKDWVGMAGSYNNIGLILQDQEKLEEALPYYQKGLELCEKVGEKQIYATLLNNIGLIHQEKGNYEESFKFFEKSLAIRKEMEEQLGISQSLHNIASNYFQLKSYEQSLEFALSAYKIADEWNLAIEKREAAYLLKDIYNKLGRYKDAFLMYDIFFSMRDSLEKEENRKEVIRQEFDYEYAKKTAADSVRAVENKKVIDARFAQKDAELKAKRTQQWLLYGGLGLVLLFTLFIFNRFKLSQRQNKIIEEQKHIVEEKQKEILDSINYAKRIQAAILPPDKLVKEYLPQSFILYKPKDIVAGDFYWMENNQDTLLIAACDCTGHGVPGAMVSVVCNNGLNRAVREYGLKDPGKILDKTRELVIQEFEKSEEEVKDGMDISLLCFENGRLKWSGANNPLWIIRNGELIEYKANKQPIGKYTEPKPFTTHEIEIYTKDSIYIFTDGFQDQFGGEKGKKFKAAKFKELLLSVQNKSMEEQRSAIDTIFESWKSGFEQNDDVCVIGIKI